MLVKLLSPSHYSQKKLDPSENLNVGVTKLDPFYCDGGGKKFYHYGNMFVSSHFGVVESIPHSTVEVKNR